MHMIGFAEIQRVIGWWQDGAAGGWQSRQVIDVVAQLRTAKPFGRDTCNLRRQLIAHTSAGDVAILSLRFLVAVDRIGEEVSEVVPKREPRVDEIRVHVELPITNRCVMLA
jgi:hypothetical protein